MAAVIFHVCGLRSGTRVFTSVLGIGCLFLFVFGCTCVHKSVFARGSTFLLVSLLGGKECRARA